MDDVRIKELIFQAVQGDQTAMNNLLRLYFPRLERLAIRNMGQLVAAKIEPQDIVQKTAVRAFGAIRAFIPGENVTKSFEGWLRKILLRRINSESNRVGYRILTRFEDDCDNMLLDTASRLSRALSKKQAAEVTTQAVWGLEESLRQIVVLYYFDGFKLSEIAKRIGLSISQVKSRLSKARSQLQKTLGRHSRFYLSS